MKEDLPVQSDSVLAVAHVAKRYGDVAALHPMSHAFKSGTTTVLIGPSGCGKSTLLRLLVGLIKPDAGQVWIQGEALTPENVEALRRKIGYVIQEGGLFPHLIARDNVALLATYLNRDKAWIEQRINDLAAMVQLPRTLLDQYPGQLSGGQRQRVSLMRALMLDPPILLLDEPMGALDPIIRYDLQSQLREIFQQLRKTVVLVTHDINEAAYLGDEIVLMRDGQILQRGTLRDLQASPCEPFVTAFIRAQRACVPLQDNGELP